MERKHRLFVRGFLGVIIALFMATCVWITWLAVPGTPGASKAVTFNGYLELPRSKPLSVLDYISFHDNSLYVTSILDGSVFKVDLGGSTPAISRVDVLHGAGSAHGVVFDPVSGLGFATHEGSNTVDVFSPSDLSVRKHIPVPEDADSIFYEPEHKLIYVACGHAKVATIIDPATQTVVGTIQLGGKPEFAVYDAETRRLYQNLEDTDTLATVDLGSMAVVDKQPLPDCKGPSGIAMDATDRRLFIVCGGNKRMLVFDPDHRRVVTSLQIGGGADAVAYDPQWRRIYSAGLSGVLDVVQQDAPDVYRHMDSVRTHYGAHTLGIDPARHKVYVAYASLFASPRLAVFTPKRP